MSNMQMGKGVVVCMRKRIRERRARRGGEEGKKAKV